MKFIVFSAAICLVFSAPFAWAEESQKANDLQTIVQKCRSISMSQALNQKEPKACQNCINTCEEASRLSAEEVKKGGKRESLTTASTHLLNCKYQCLSKK